MRFLDFHLARLQRDAGALGLGRVSAEAVREALEGLGEAAFGAEAGIVRLAVREAAAGPPRLVGEARSLGNDAPHWSAAVAPFPHAERPAPGGAKCAARPLYARASGFAEAAGVDEALLCDPQDRLVEGSRTNLVYASEDGVASVPPREREAVAGVALAVVARRVPLAERDVHRADLSRLRELVALNAVIGARPVVEVDGRPVGEGAAGPLADTLVAALAAEDNPQEAP